MMTLGPTGQETRIVQIHPSLRCNLRCHHCYSTSSPDGNTRLTTPMLKGWLTFLRSEGYNAVSISGGEPLMVADLPDLLAYAKTLGMMTAMTTNAMLLTEKRMETLQGLVDVLAISVDGVPESHNRVRAQKNAFEGMHKRLEGVRAAGQRFGFIFTLTLHNLHELAWVAEFAAKEGAFLLQVHPLEEVGRARTDLHRAAPDARELTYGFLEVARLQKQYAGRLQIQYDAVDIDIARHEPERLLAIPPLHMAEYTQEPLAALLSPLVLEADGTLVPIQYGFDHRFAIAHSHGNLNEQFQAWKATRYAEFLELCRRVYEEIMATASPRYPFVNWYGFITEASRRYHFNNEENQNVHYGEVALP
jgi:Fe-coproporphyrin III synthase